MANIYIVVKNAKTTGHASPSGTEESAAKRISAARYVVSIPLAGKTPSNPTTKNTVPQHTKIAKLDTNFAR